MVVSDSKVPGCAARVLHQTRLNSSIVKFETSNHSEYASAHILPLNSSIKQDVRVRKMENL